MKVKFWQFCEFLFIECYIFSSVIYLVELKKVVIHRVPKTQLMNGKNDLEAEMSYFTQKFLFVNTKDEYGTTMHSFLWNHLNIISHTNFGKSVFQLYHWKTTKDANYKYKGLFCQNYIKDLGINESGVELAVGLHLSSIREFEEIIEFNYYSTTPKQASALRCPVKVDGQVLSLYFMKFRNCDDSEDVSYFVLSNKFSSPTSLEVLMYITYRKEKKTSENLLKIEKKPSKLHSFKSRLVSIPEESSGFDLPETTTPEETKDPTPAAEDVDRGKEKIQEESTSEIKHYEEEIRRFQGKIDFRRILKKTFKKEGEEYRIVFLGKLAETVFLTAVKFYFINLHCPFWLIDEFVEKIKNLKKGNEILAKEDANLEDANKRRQLCPTYIRNNPALRRRNIVPNLDEEQLNLSSYLPKLVVFPQAEFPPVNFNVRFLKCPALSGEAETPIFIYMQKVYFANDGRKPAVFTLLESDKVTDAVYPATLSYINTLFAQFSFENFGENLPSSQKNVEEKSHQGDAGPSTST